MNLISPLLLSGAQTTWDPVHFLEISMHSPGTEHFPFLCDSPETQSLPGIDSSLLHWLQAFTEMLPPSGEFPHHTWKTSALSSSVYCPALSLSLSFFVSLTASRDGAVGERRCGERVGWYLLPTGFAGKETVFLQRQGMNINCR